MVSFYADNCVPIKTTELLRSYGHDAVAARDIHQRRASDDQQLLTAAENRWIFVTHDKADFPLLHDAWRRWSQAWRVKEEHSGILVTVQNMPADEEAQAVHSFVMGNPPLSNALYELEKDGSWHRRP